MGPKQQFEHSEPTANDASPRWISGGMVVELLPSRSATSDLEAEFRSHPGSACGLLLGDWLPARAEGPRTVHVESCLSFAARQRTSGWLEEEMAPLAELVKAWGESPGLPTVVGYFASLGNGEEYEAIAAELDAVRGSFPVDGVLVMTAHLAGPELRAALLRPEDPTWTVRWVRLAAPPEAGDAVEDVLAAGGMPAPLMPGAGRQAEKGISERQPRPPQPPPGRTPLLKPAGKRGGGAVWLLGGAAVCAAISLGTAGYVWMRSSTAGPGPAAPAAAIATTATGPAATPLGMQVTRRGGDLEISWSRDGKAMETAQRGYLEIRDGTRKTQVFLEQSQLRSGRVLYAPRSGDIDIRLEVLTPDDRIVRESLRVIQASVPGETAAAIRMPNASAEPGEAQERTRQGDPAGEETVQDNAADRRVFVPPAQRAASAPAGTARFEPGPPPLPANALAQQPALLAQGPLSALPVPSAAADTSFPGRMIPAADAWQPPVPVRQVRVPMPAGIRTLIVNPVDIEVKLSLDERGRVLRAEVAPQANTLNSQLAALARSTAQQWVFAPAKRGSLAVASTYSVIFRFRR